MTDLQQSSDDDADYPHVAETGVEWSGDEIEDAYRKALEASEALDELPEELTPAVNADSTLLDASPTDDAEAAATIAEAQVVEPVLDIAPDAPQVTPEQIIEAALFVGGGPLTARKLVGLLRGSFDVQFVEQTIDALNQQYAEQARPYEVRLGDGGYRLQLLAEFEKYRHRVYGTGPREVKLSQEALEVLAVVAYKQPIAQAQIDELGKRNAGNLLRQLLRRELIGLTRGENGPKDIRYHTTPRFLQLFGLGSLQDLPQTEDVAVK